MSTIGVVFRHSLRLRGYGLCCPMRFRKVKHPGVFKVMQAFVGNVLGVEGETAPEGWFCSMCGSEAGSYEEQCAVCGGGSNPIGKLWGSATIYFY